MSRIVLNLNCLENVWAVKYQTLLQGTNQV